MLGGWRSGNPLHVEKEPGSCFTYSGEGFLYLQTGIEQLTARALNEWMEQALLGPLNMTRSSYEWNDALENNFAGGHDKDGKFKTGRRFYTSGNAAYSLYTTPTDYARFLIEEMLPKVAQSYALTDDPNGRSQGDRVSVGDVIGFVGAIGTTSATNFHLHFEESPKNLPVDPLPLLYVDPTGCGVSPKIR